MNQYQQLLFLPSFLLSKELNLHCPCELLPLFQGSFKATALLQGGADSLSDLSTFHRITES